jgi:type 1 fimbria pilin
VISYSKVGTLGLGNASVCEVSTSSGFSSLSLSEKKVSVHLGTVKASQFLEI